jgi:GT2 family glycosyltransferase
VGHCEQGIPAGRYSARYDFKLRAARAGFDLFCHYDAVLYSLSDTFKLGRKHRENYSLSNYFYYLTNIRSGANLKGQWRFAWRNAPRYALLPYFAAITARVMGGYLLRWTKYRARSMLGRTEKTTHPRRPARGDKT